MMRKSVVLVLGALFCACAGEEPAPVLSVTPSGTVTAAGPTAFTADPVTIADKVSWSLSGPGTISDNAGRSIIYRPPAQVDPSQTATLTATAVGQTVTVQIHPAPPQVPAPPLPGLHGPVNVLYDAQQIPHVFCGNQLDCFEVQGYLHGQDRLFETDFYRRTARGTLSTLLGQNGVSTDKQFLTLFTTRDGKKVEDEIVANLDPQTKAIIDAYRDGFNAYLEFLKAHPTLMPGEYAQLSAAITPNDIPQWTEADTAALARLEQLQLSESISDELNNGLFAAVYGDPSSPLADSHKVNAYFNVRQPVASYTLSTSDSGIAPIAAAAPAVAPVSNLAPWISGMGAAAAQMSDLRAVLGAMGLGAGSNNWIVDAAHSATGHALVANDPHLSLEYPPLFHVSAMTASDSSGLDVAGATFPGIPGILSGRGKHIVFGVTTVGYDVTDLYREKLAACTGTPLPCNAVTYNGTPEAFVAAQYTIKVRGGSDVPWTVLVAPHHGPLLNYDPAHQTALSVRWTGQEPYADLNTFMQLAVATSVGSVSNAAPGTAFGAIKNFTVGAQNFVIADDQGHIGYDPHAYVPRRDWAGSTPTGSTSPLLPWIPLPGDNGSAEWGSGVAADNCAGNATAGTIPARACWVPDDQLPQGTDPAKGYYATANSDPIGATDDGNPFGSATSPSPGAVAGTFYPYLSYEWSDPTALRYGRIASLLAKKTASGGKVSVDDMEAIQSDHSLTFAKLMLQLFPATGTTQYNAAKAILDTWAGDDFDCPTGLSTTDPNSAPDTDPVHARDAQACMLFHTFLRQVLHQVFDDDMAVVGKATGQSFSADQGAEIRALFYMLTPVAASNGDTTFCNDVDPSTGAPKASHTCQDQVISALSTAQATLTGKLGAQSNWIWGRYHTLTVDSPLAPLVAGGFSAGPYARPGGANTVDVGSPSLSSTNPVDFSYAHGSVIRHVAEATDPATAVDKLQIPGPERDLPNGQFANTPDLLGLYVRNQYFDFLVSHQVDAKAVSSQGFTAP